MENENDEQGQPDSKPRSSKPSRKRVKLVLVSKPEVSITTANDDWLITTKTPTEYEIVPVGDQVGFKEVGAERYWTVEWRGPVGDLHGVTLKAPLGPKGTLGQSQLFTLENTSQGYWIRESTKREYVSVGSNGVIARWSKESGSTQIFKEA